MILIDLPIWINALIVGGLFLLLLVSGMWIGIAMIGVGLFILFFMAPGAQNLAGLAVFNSVNSFTLIAVPLFVFMGEIVLKSGLGKMLYTGAANLTSAIPGGLLHSNVLACSIFAAFSGSSLAATATIGSIAIPEQDSRGYNPRLVRGSISASGTLGILIPPSIIMIVYGTFVGVSVARLFIGGIFPGIILAGMFSSYIIIRSLINPHLCPKRDKLTWSYFLKAVSSFKYLWPSIVLIGIVMGGIYAGYTTPTEAAAIGVLMAMVLAAVFHKLTFQIIKESATTTLEIIGMIFIIVVGASIMAIGLSLIKLPAELSAFILGFNLDRMILWFLAVIMYLILGCFIEVFSLMLLTLPVTFFLFVEQLGFDPIWFGVVLTILVEVALITPPVGTNLYVLHSVGGGRPLEDIIIGVIPFFLLMIGAIIIYSFFPDIVTWLPDTLFALH